MTENFGSSFSANVARQRPSSFQKILRTLFPSFVPADPTRILGIDVSHYDGIVDWNVAKANGIRFVIVKCCDGTVKSKYFDENWAGAKAVGLPRAAYNWLYPSDKISGTTQANAWWNVLSADPGEFGPFTDYEWTYWAGVPANPYEKDLYGVLTRYFALSGKMTGIYSSKGYCGDHPLSDYEGQCVAWLAGYNGGATPPAIPYPWTNSRFASNVKIHQFTDQGDGSLYGVNPSFAKDVDLNYFLGTEEEFQEFVGGTPVPPPDPAGDAMYKVTCSNTVNIRASDGGTLGNIIGALSTGQTGHGTEISGSPTGTYYSLHITDVDGTPIDGWVYARWNNGNTFATIEEVVTPPPPVETVPHMDMTLTDKDGTVYRFVADGVKQ